MSTFESLKRVALVGSFIVFICAPLQASAYSADGIFNSYIEALSNISNQLAGIIVSFQNYSQDSLAQVATSANLPIATGKAISAIQMWADPALISKGQSSKLTYSPVNATACWSTGVNVIGKTPAYTTFTLTPTQTTDYIITCTNGGDSATSVTVRTRITVNGTTSPAPDSTKFKSGDQVQVSDTDTYVRIAPTMLAPTYWLQTKGAIGTIIDGPILATDHVWWKINYGGNVIGWTAEEHLNPAPAPVPPPVATSTLSFWATPALIQYGQSSTLGWTSQHTSSCILSDGSTGSPANGTHVVTPTVTTKYTITCAGSGGEISKTLTVTVNGSAPTPKPVPTASLIANPISIVAGESSSLTWSSTNATTCIGTNFSTNNAVSGSLTISPSSTTTYSISCTGAGGNVSADTTVGVTPPVPSIPKPDITFWSTPALINAGQSSQLAWIVFHATSCSMDKTYAGSGTSVSGFKVTPTVTTSYTLSCAGAGGTSSKTLTIKVQGSVPPPPPAPAVSISVNPSSVVSGQSSMVSWSSTNATSCSSTGFTPGNATAGTISVTPGSNTIYLVTCTGVGGSTSASTSLAVTSPAPVPGQYPKGPKFGLYFGGIWGTNSTTTVAKYEANLNRPVELIGQFDGENYAWTGSNSIASAASWVYTQANAALLLQPPRRLVFGIHLGILKPWPPVGSTTQTQFDKQNFADIVAGKHDDAYLSVGKGLVSKGFTNAYIRLGQEGNGSWFPGFAGSDKAGFVAAWNHVAALLYSVPGNHFEIGLDFSSDRSITTYTTGIDWSLVKFINLDVYNQTYQTSAQVSPQARWNYTLGHGINEWLALGKSTGKPLAVFEWGTGGAGTGITGGDDPYFIDKMWEVITNPANNVIAAVYWQNNGGYSGVLSDTQSPNAWAEYKLKFGGANPPLNANW